MNGDLLRGSHLSRNAQEDYQHLVASGVSHERALQQVGMTKASWANIAGAAAQRERRVRRAVASAHIPVKGAHR